MNSQSSNQYWDFQYVKFKGKFTWETTLLRRVWEIWEKSCCFIKTPTSSLQPCWAILTKISAKRHRSTFLSENSLSFWKVLRNWGIKFRTVQIDASQWKNINFISFHLKRKRDWIKMKATSILICTIIWKVQKKICQKEQLWRIFSNHWWEWILEKWVSMRFDRWMSSIRRLSEDKVGWRFEEVRTQIQVV